MPQNRRKSANYVQTSVTELGLVRQRTEKLGVLHVAALVMAVLKPLTVYRRVKFTPSEVDFSLCLSQAVRGSDQLRGFLRDGRQRGELTVLAQRRRMEPLKNSRHLGSGSPTPHAILYP